MSWLRAEPTSIATLRAVAALLRAIREAASSTPTTTTTTKPSPHLSAEASLSVLTLLEPNLASPCHLLRLSTVRVLARYDPLPFSSDSAALPTIERQQRQHQEIACDFLEVAEALETLPISLAAERDIMWRLGQLEVMGRGGRLPRPYVSLMATHALGLLRVKFSGVWPRATAIISTLCQRPQQRQLAWEPVYTALRKVMPPPATRHIHQQSSSASGQTPVTPHIEREQADGGRGGEMTTAAAAAVATKAVIEGQSGLRKFVPPPQPWVSRLLPHAAVLDAGPTEEVDLPVALQGVFLDDSVKAGLEPESGEVPLWASTDDDAAFTQVRCACKCHQ